jgi:hypothetical protein
MELLGPDRQVTKSWRWPLGCGGTKDEGLGTLRPRENELFSVVEFAGHPQDRGNLITMSP